MAGAVTFALALWEPGPPRPGPQRTPERAVRLLALADLFAYNRMLPSDEPGTRARDAAERARPGAARPAARRADAGPRRVELRDEVGGLVSAS